MPFGLTNVPAVFQALVNDVLRDFLNHFSFVYLNDILIFSTELDSHWRQVCQVLKSLLQHHLQIKAESFMPPVMSFLGYISEGNIGMDPEKVTAGPWLAIVVWLHGFRVDVVSDRGPQLIKKFWKAFCTLIGGHQSALCLVITHNPMARRLNQELE